VIVGAEVTVTSLTTSEERKVTTTTEGNYTALLLPPGSYRVSVTASGFNSAIFDAVQVVITETATVNAQLTVAGIMVDPITVRVAPLLQTGASQMGRVVDSRAVSELPLATRNFTQILALSPGASVALPDNTALGRNSQNVSVNGARVTQNDFEINGIDANKIDTNSATSLAVPAPETIQEFKVQTPLYDATFGRNSLTSSVLVALGLTDDRLQQTLLATFRPRSQTGLPATSINSVALALLNAKLPDGQFMIPTPQADGRYSGAAISTYREDQFNTNVDYRINDRNWLAGKMFFSNAPQFLALPNGGENVPGFGADRKQNNCLVALQDIYTLSSRTFNEARVGYSFIRQDTFGRNPVRDSDFGIKRANADTYPGLGLIRIGSGVTTGNSGTSVDMEVSDSSTTLVDILSIIRGRHSIRTGTEVIYYRTALTANNARRGQITFQSFNNFLLGTATNSTYGDGVNTRSLRATDYSFFLQCLIRWLTIGEEISLAQAAFFLL